LNFTYFDILNSELCFIHFACTSNNFTKF
jgi:hypothetical protein